MKYFIVLVTLFCCDSIVLSDNYIGESPFDVNLHVTGGDGCDWLERIDADEVLSCMLVGQSFAKDDFDHGAWLPKRGIRLRRNNTGYFRFNSGSLPQTVTDIYHSSSIMLKGLEILLNNNKSYKYPPLTFMKLLYKKKFSLHGICTIKTFKKLCTKHLNDVFEYRTFDGSCNNLENPTWGMTYSVYSRMVAPKYSDGIHKPAISVLGGDLPSAREISLKAFLTCVKPDAQFTLMTGEMAQLIAHDCTMTINDNVDDGPIMCCSDDGSCEVPDYLKHKSCFPIKIPANDPFYSQYGQRCMQFVRSVTGLKDNCLLGPAEQINGVTSYMDCNFLYGFTQERAESLRSFRDGKLLNSSQECGSMLPLTNPSVCDARTSSEFCYLAGDPRVNQNPHLVTMQIVFMREHNRISGELKLINPHWDDERLFQEARRIVIAIYQHIVYREYLPLILGKSFIASLFDNCDQHGFTSKYDENINAGCLNSMNIAFRCCHSTISTNITTCSESCSATSQHSFSDWLLRPVFAASKYDQILNSFSCSPMMKMDACVTPEITNKLFKFKSSFGLDLMALDIQRGRDHGLPGYNKFRKICGLKEVTSFEELIRDIGRKKVNRLQECYAHVDDIDLIVGAMMEKHVKGTQFGPVILFILQEQFYRFMVGDRFFYTNKQQTYPFTPAQLKQIQKMSIARLICDNGNQIKIIQRHAFEMESESNTRERCHNIPALDLSPWKDRNEQ